MKEYLYPRLLVLLLAVMTFVCGYKVGKEDADRYWQVRAKETQVIDDAVNAARAEVKARIENKVYGPPQAPAPAGILFDHTGTDGVIQMSTPLSARVGDLVQLSDPPECVDIQNKLQPIPCDRVLTNELHDFYFNGTKSPEPKWIPNDDQNVVPNGHWECPANWRIGWLLASDTVVRNSLEYVCVADSTEIPATNELHDFYFNVPQLGFHCDKSGWSESPENGVTVYCQ